MRAGCRVGSRRLASVSSSRHHNNRAALRPRLPGRAAGFRNVRGSRAIHHGLGGVVRCFDFLILDLSVGNPVPRLARRTQGVIKMADQTTTRPDALDHIAISVSNVAEAVAWYREHFNCTVRYQDDTWAFLQFANIRLALVIPEQHPPHLAFVTPEAERFGTLKPHRDGTRSVYVQDPAGNAVEIMAPYE